MAAITAPERTAAQHQSLLHFIGEGKWWDERVLAKVRIGAAGDGAPRADRSMDHRRYRLSQEGTAFVGVARQYCGEPASARVRV